ncbi:nitrite/Sulfite reductase ferredoxin-like half domain protein [Mycobacterium ulcerans str. Harvey]|uniref:Nitrite/Sulfite reductase ferredoxin-like half domain protein n=1 Tax=Mycobacterium ulcerans str. Harvey TaxID=1299332 RepID=A0ABP3AHQ5_MYCUL|nr:nitrite/Sulfite reductase ferredoxin-like half domain protein [Mycobacterium ulcerans str. Harvey]
MRVLGQISSEFGRDTADIGDRENVQFHWLRIEDVPEIWRRLESVGLSSIEACGDCPRGIHGSPLAGDSLDEVLDPSPAIDEIIRRFLDNPTTRTCPASTRARSRACRTSPTRPTTSRSSESITPSTVPGWTCGSVAAFRPTR